MNRSRKTWQSAATVVGLMAAATALSGANASGQSVLAQAKSDTSAAGSGPAFERYWEEQWKRLNDHVVWAKGEPLVPYWGSGPHMPTYKPVMLVGGKPDAPYRPEDGVDIEKVFLDNHCLIWETDRDGLDVLLRRTRALLEGLRQQFGLRLDEDAAALGKLETAAKSEALDSPRRKELFVEACALERRIALTNPLLDFDEIIFMTGNGGIRGRWQDVGFDSGGGWSLGPMVLSDWKTASPKIRRVLPDRFEIDGKPVNLAADAKGKGAGAPFHINYDLSFDGKTLLFAAGHHPAQIFKYELGTSEVVQLTRSRWDHGYVPENRPEPPASSGYPCWLPDGRIAYCSERGAKGDRCEGRTCQLYSMKADGSDSHPISWHETPEYHPVVDHDGMLVYSRWDYVDRGFAESHSLWRCQPDGRDPRGPHGNYSKPFFGNSQRWLRPYAQLHIRPIPGAHGQYVMIAGHHHRALPGLPVLIDLGERDDAKMAQVRILVGHFMLHEDGGPLGRNDKALPGFAYVTPWPLGRDFHLISDLKNLVLLDRWGNVVPLYCWDGPDYACSPRPLRAVPAPPVIPTATWQGERAGRPDHRRATIAVQNVYDYDLGWPEGVVEEKRIKALRIVQLLGLPIDFRNAGKDRGHRWPIGHGVKQIARTVLGTVPVEEDGSAYFEAPVGKLLSFQALDERGMMIVGMRSGTYVHPGEQLSCQGCHEDKWQAPKAYAASALRRGPSKITPEPEGSNPLTYYRLVKPVFEKTCLPCHVKEKQGLQSFDYNDLREPVVNGRKRGGYIYYVGAWGVNRGCRSEPYKMGAHGSLMGQALLKSHVDRITAEEFRRVIVWLDCCSPRYGTYFDLEAQAEGKVVWHPLEVDPKDPLGIEHDRPLPGAAK